MTVIAVLVGLLLPAIGNIRRTARLTEVKAEITQMETALASFEARFGVLPPSAVILPADPTDPANWDPTSRRRIRQVWPQFNFATVGGLDSAYFGGRDSIVLTGAECLAFFLGGIPSTGGSAGVWSATSGDAPLMTGFSKNPRTPFAFGGTNRDVLFEFDAARMIDVDGDGFPEYVDSLPDQTTPFLYVRASGPNKYPVQIPDAVDDFDVFNSNDVSGAGVLLYDGAWTDSLGGNLLGAYARPGTGVGVGAVWKGNSFQLISPGPDFLYSSTSEQDFNGVSGFDAEDDRNGNGFQDPAAYVGFRVYDDAGQAAAGEEDNLANFSSGLKFGN
jgi:type II secretory pathway pseudopilin PulG